MPEDLKSVIQQTQYDQRVYSLAREYLLSLDTVTPEMLNRHLFISADERPNLLSGIYERLLGAAQGGNMGPTVIGQAIGGVDKLESLLGGFQPAAVVEKYGGDWEAVLDDIVIQLKPRGKIRRTSRSLWPRFCKTIISGAEFLAQFDEATDFYQWVDIFDQDDRVRPALPMLLSFEVDGIGFPLACDFIKDLGYLNFCKPDVHLKTIVLRYS